MTPKITKRELEDVQKAYLKAFQDRLLAVKNDSCRSHVTLIVRYSEGPEPVKCLPDVPGWLVRGATKKDDGFHIYLEKEEDEDYEGKKKEKQWPPILTG